MQKLAEFFENKTKPKYNIISIIGWFTYGGNNRVKHFYVVNNRTSSESATTICNEGYYITPRDDLNKNPYAKVSCKCKACVRRIKYLFDKKG